MKKMKGACELGPRPLATSTLLLLVSTPFRSPSFCFWSQPPLATNLLATPTPLRFVSTP